MNYRDYELLIREIFQQMLDQSYAPNIVVEHDVVKHGLKTTHQIDVYWEFKLGGIVYQTVVQVKNWAKPVDQGEALKFDGVLKDLPGQPRGRDYMGGRRKFVASTASPQRTRAR